MGFYTRATDFGSRHLHIGLGVYRLRVYALGDYTRATDFGSRHPLIPLGLYILGVYTEGVYTRATDFGSRIGLDGYTLGVYTLELYIRATDSGSRHPGFALGGSGVSGDRFRIWWPTCASVRRIIKDPST